LQLGIIPEAATDVAVVKPSDFGKAAEAICRLTLPEIAAKYKHVSETDAPFACLDIAYQATLLTKGFSKS
jgi:apyrase